MRAFPPAKGRPRPNLPDSLSRLPWFEELRARAERAAADALSLLTKEPGNNYLNHHCLGLMV
jgi:hypothetical protein